MQDHHAGFSSSIDRSLAICSGPAPQQRPQARDEHELQHKGTGYEANHATFKGEVEPDGTVHLDEKRRYDPTEILMKKYGNDPYAD